MPMNPWAKVLGNKLLDDPVGSAKKAWDGVSTLAKFDPLVGALSQAGNPKPDNNVLNYLGHMPGGGSTAMAPFWTKMAMEAEDNLSQANVYRVRRGHPDYVEGTTVHVLHPKDANKLNSLADKAVQADSGSDKDMQIQNKASDLLNSHFEKYGADVVQSGDRAYHADDGGGYYTIKKPMGK